MMRKSFSCEEDVTLQRQVVRCEGKSWHGDRGRPRHASWAKPNKVKQPLKLAVTLSSRLKLLTPTPSSEWHILRVILGGLCKGLVCQESDTCADTSLLNRGVILLNQDASTRLATCVSGSLPSASFLFDLYLKVVLVKCW